MFLSLMEIAACTLVIMLFITQVLTPFFKGTPLFPMLSAERRLIAQLEKERQKTHLFEIQQEIKSEREKRNGKK